MAAELKTNNMAYEMKGSPMQRNFGVGEKESPLKVAPALAAALPYIYAAGASAVASAGVGAVSASVKKKRLKREADEKKKQDALKDAAEGISNDMGGKKSRLVD